MRALVAFPESSDTTELAVLFSTDGVLICPQPGGESSPHRTPIMTMYNVSVDGSRLACAYMIIGSAIENEAGQVERCLSIVVTSD